MGGSEVHLEAQVEVAKAEGAGSSRSGAPCFPNLLVELNLVYLLETHPQHSQGATVPGNPKVSVATINWAPCQAKGTQFIRREVPFKKRIESGALEVEGRAK